MAAVTAELELPILQEDQDKINGKQVNERILGEITLIAPSTKHHYEMHTKKEREKKSTKRFTVLDELGSNLGSSVCGVDDSSSAASGNSLGGGGILADNHSVRRQYDETINVSAQIDLHDVVGSKHGVLYTKEGVNGER